MTLVLILLVLIILLALFFDFTNGFHDSSNIVATMISSRAMSPMQALLMAATAEFIGAYFLGTAVAKMMGKGIVDPQYLQDISAAYIIIATLIAAIGWNLLTWYFGIPSSSSHALIGGLVGAFIIARGMNIINWFNVGMIFVVLITSPLIGGLAGAGITRFCRWFFRYAPPSANTAFKRLQIFSSMGLALSHGTNDAQKTMGIITLTMLIIGPATLPGWMTDDGALHGGAGAVQSEFAPGQFTGELRAEALRDAVRADFPEQDSGPSEPVPNLNALLTDSGFSVAWLARKGASVELDTRTRQLLTALTARNADTAGAAGAVLPVLAAGNLPAMTFEQQIQRLNRLLLEQSYPQCPKLANNFTVPHWVIISCSLAIALGISSGGWTIIKTLGGKLFKVQPINGFASQAASGLVIYIAAVTGFPVSTTQIVSSSIMGSGAAERPKAVRWGVIGNILITWLITIPGSAAIGAVSYYLINVLFIR